MFLFLILGYKDKNRITNIKTIVYTRKDIKIFSHPLHKPLNISEGLLLSGV